MTPENTVNEFFELFDRGDNAVQVVPLTIKEQDDDTRLAIFIRGDRHTASLIMAALMDRLDELHDLQTQADAVAEATDGSESRIITS